MAANSVRFHPEAEKEYLASLAWYKERSPSAASNFEREFRRAVSAISKSPERWPTYFSNYRRYVLHQFPFSVIYRSFQEQEIVVAVAHAHRRPGYWRRRLSQ